jgi:tetratricopeptide (TPR) repeat protein
MSRIVQGMFVDAVRRHQAGRLAEAEQRFRSILAIQPRHADSLFSVGLIACQGGRYDVAVELIGKAIRIRQDNPFYHFSLGNALAAQGKNRDAATRYKRALALKPDYADAHKNLGVVLVAEEKFMEAIGHYERTLILAPDCADTHNNLAVALKAAGRVGDAAAHYIRALTINPDHAMAHNNVGLLFSDQGRVDDAIPHYVKALAVKPDYADANNNLGSALLAKGKVRDAQAHYERAIAIDPNHAAAHNNLGNLFCERGKHADAVKEYERALVLKPNSADTHGNLGIALAAQGRIEDAAAQCRKGIALDPHHAKAHNSLGNILKEAGKFDEAMAHLERAVAIKPDYAEAHFNRADIKTFHPGDPDLAALEALAGRNGWSAKQAPYIHFALAKALEDCGDYTRAFEHFQIGNGCKRRQVEYDEASDVRLFESIASIFDGPLLDRFEGEGDPSAVPIFVLGMPRSGSSLVEQILASHPQVQGAGELLDLDRIATGAKAAGSPGRYPESIAAMDGPGLRRLGQIYLSRLPAPVPGKVRVTDKLPGNFLHIGLIRLILPNARIVHTMRDPMDTCVSCYSKLFTEGVHFSYDLAELGRYYRRYSRLMSHWRSVLPANSILDVSYEKVVEDIEGQSRRLIEYCGLPWDERCLDFNKNKRPVKTASAVQVRQPLYRGSIERWRRYEAGLGPLLHELEEIQRITS